MPLNQREPKGTKGNQWEPMGTDGNQFQWEWNVCAGLLGGAVYVNAFTLISRHVDPLRREFSLAAASLGDSLGIAFADIAGILIQVHYTQMAGHQPAVCRNLDNPDNVQCTACAPCLLRCLKHIGWCLATYGWKGPLS